MRAVAALALVVWVLVGCGGGASSPPVQVAPAVTTAPSPASSPGPAGDYDYGGY